MPRATIITFNLPLTRTGESLSNVDEEGLIFFGQLSDEWLVVTCERSSHKE